MKFLLLIMPSKVFCIGFKDSISLNYLLSSLKIMNKIIRFIITFLFYLILEEQRLLLYSGSLLFILKESLLRC